jgi:hypothetical protein
MTRRPITVSARLLPPTLRGLRDVIYASPRECEDQPDLFFGPDCDDLEPEADHAARVAVAREICAACPVRLACLAYALRTGPEFGVWAGLDADAGELAYLADAATPEAVAA